MERLQLILYKEYHLISSRGDCNDTHEHQFKNYIIVKVKLSLYRPWRSLGLREFEAPTFSDIRLTDGGEVVSPTRRSLFTPRKIPDTHFCVDPRAIVRLEELGKLKKYTSSGTRTGDLPACSVVPQPITVPRAPLYFSSGQ
jgi:hypothetical protein